MIKIDMQKNSLHILQQHLRNRNQLEVSAVNQVVIEILERVKNEKNAALFHYTKLYDKFELQEQNMRVTQEEIQKAYEGVEKRYIEIIRKACSRIRNFHVNQVEKSWFMTGEDGELLGQMVRPLQCVGIYTPGGTAAYPSSVLMNSIPAKVAGVEKIIMVTPPMSDGSIQPQVLVAAAEAGVDEIYKCGGAQAIAALAYGTQTIPKVDKIVGPGNIYVATAKRLVFGYCDIDMIAGPSEITVIADATANPCYIAADLLSQAEHDSLAAGILITDSPALITSVEKALQEQLLDLPRKSIAEKSLSDYGMLILVKDLVQATEIANLIAPEHLEICTSEPFGILPAIKNAGAIFLGEYASEPMGDYMAGPNHVLPTSGTARFFSPLGVYDFIKRSSVISLSKKVFKNLSEDVMYFARKEGLEAHAKAIELRD